jgi:Glycosyltransferase sugar-binding region containing DXD motif
MRLLKSPGTRKESGCVHSVHSVLLFLVMVMVGSSWKHNVWTETFFHGQSPAVDRARNTKTGSNCTESNIDNQVIQAHDQFHLPWEPMLLSDLTRGNRPPPNCTFPYVVVNDIIVPGDPYEEPNTSSRRKIPRYVHLAWVSANENAPRRGRCLHYLQAETLKKYRQYFPHYSVYFHDDDAVDTLLRQENWPEFPHLSHILQCAKMRGAMLVDIWRVLVTYRYGGFYADLDLWPTSDVTEDLIPPDVGFFALSDNWMRPSQGTFAMVPGHHVGYYNVNEILKRIHELEDIANPRLVFVTGPEVFKYGFGHTFGWDNISKTGLLHGFYNSTALKLGKRPRMHSNVDETVTVHNQTMTYKEKIQADTGVLHWQSELKVMQQKIPRISCKQYLYELEMAKTQFPI